MKKLLPVVCVALLLGADKKDDAKKDADKLEGKWVVKSAERGGKDVDLDKEEHIPKSITIKGDKITVSTRKDEEHEATVKVGREGKLGTLDLTPDKDKDRLVEAELYRLEGDTLTICINEGNLGERPTEIAAKEGTVVVILKRDKK